MDPKVSIIVLNWNGWKDTIECLESIYQIDYSHYNVVLIDNNSEDESLDKIREYCKGNIKITSKFSYFNLKKPLKVLEISEEKLKSLNEEYEFFRLNANAEITLIKNKVNYGFTKGNNIGINYALKYLNPTYVLLLNNDTIVEKSFLSELVKIGEKHPNVGFIGPKIYFYEYEGKFDGDVIQYAGGDQNLWRFEPHSIGHGELDENQFDQNQEVDFISGACMLVKTDTIKDIGLLDENFFSYREENDWCMRGYKAGWKSVYAYKSIIWHKEQGSTKNKEIKPLVLYYMTRNKFLFIKKHANNKIELVSFLGYFFLFDFWYWLLASLLYRKRLNKINLKLVKCYLKSVYDGLKSW